MKKKQKLNLNQETHKNWRYKWTKLHCSVDATSNAKQLNQNHDTQLNNINKKDTNMI